MTQPAGDAPGAPATNEPSATPVDVAPGLDPNAPVDIATLPANVQQLIKGLRTEAAGHRTGRTAAERAAAESKAQRDGVLKALGLNEDGSAALDPEAAIGQLTGRAEAAENAAWSAGAKLQIFQAAGPLGANATALLDSVTFLDSLDDLVGTDPNTPEFRTAMEAKIQAAVNENASLTAARTAAGKSGGDFSGGSGAGTPITEAQLAAMSPDEVTKALAEGRLKHLL